MFQWNTISFRCVCCAFAFTQSPDVFGCPLLSPSAYSLRKDLSLDSEFMEFLFFFFFFLRLKDNRNSNHALSALPHLSAEATVKLKLSSLFCRHWDPNVDCHPWGASTVNLGTTSLVLNKTFSIKLKTIYCDPLGLISVHPVVFQNVIPLLNTNAFL